MRYEATRNSTSPPSGPGRVMTRGGAGHCAPPCSTTSTPAATSSCALATMAAAKSGPPGVQKDYRGARREGVVRATLVGARCPPTCGQFS